MRQMAGEGYSNATDFADYLVQKLNIPFRDAHHITGRVVAVAIQKELKIEELSLVELQEIKPEIEQDIFDFIKIENVVARRNSFGGTGFEQVKKQIEFAKDYLKNL